MPPLGDGFDSNYESSDLDSTGHCPSSDICGSSIGTFASRPRELTGCCKDREVAPTERDSKTGAILIERGSQVTTFFLPSVICMASQSLPHQHERLINRHQSELEHDADFLSQIGLDRFAFEHLTPYFQRSTQSQEALQQWDTALGLRPTHAQATLNSARTRRMLLELLQALAS